MASIEETVQALEGGADKLDEAWDSASQAKESLMEGRETIARVGGQTPPETLGNALQMVDEAYAQIEQGQALLQSAQDLVRTYMGVVNG